MKTNLVVGNLFVAYHVASNFAAAGLGYKVMLLTLPRNELRFNTASVLLLVSISVAVCSVGVHCCSLTRCRCGHTSASESLQQ